MTIDIGLSKEQLDMISPFSPVRASALKHFFLVDHPELDDDVLQKLQNELTQFNLDKYSFQCMSLLKQQHFLIDYQYLLATREELSTLSWHLQRTKSITLKQALAQANSITAESDEYWKFSYWLLFFLKCNQFDNSVYAEGQNILNWYINYCKNGMSLLQTNSNVKQIVAFGAADIGKYAKASATLLAVSLKLGEFSNKILEGFKLESVLALVKEFTILKGTYDLQLVYDVWKHFGSECFSYVTADTKNLIYQQLLDILGTVETYSISLEYLESVCKSAFREYFKSHDINVVRGMFNDCFEVMIRYNAYHRDFVHVANTIIKKCLEVDTIGKKTI